MRPSFMFMLLVAAFAGAADAQVYKWVDKDGKVHYSDQPHKDAKPADLKPLTTVEPIPVRAASEADDTAPAVLEAGYTEFRFTRPTPGETLSNIGTLLVVQLELEPSLQADHTIFVTYDGKRYQASGTTVTLTEVFRGAHTISAEITDAAGKVIATAGPVSFNVQQSSLLPKPAPKPPKK